MYPIFESQQQVSFNLGVIFYIIGKEVKIYIILEKSQLGNINDIDTVISRACLKRTFKSLSFIRLRRFAEFRVV